MPNVIKSATTVSTGTLKKNNFLIGVNTSVDYGPTSTSGFWSGVNPPLNGYTVYSQKTTGGPSIRVAQTDSELITIAKQYGGTGINTINDALNYFNGTSTNLVTNIEYENIVTSGLTAIWDGGFVPSYPRTGTTWTDLSGNAYDLALIGPPVYSGSSGNDVLGKTSIGASSGLELNFWACAFTATTDGTIIRLNSYFGTSSTTTISYKFAIWADNGSGQPGSLLASSSAVTESIASQSRSIPIDYTFTAGEVLHFGVVADDWLFIYYDAGSVNQTSIFNVDYTTYPTVPNPPTVSVQYANEITIYADYTPAGGSGGLYFDGVSDTAQSTSITLSYPQGYSLSMWFEISSISTNGGLFSFNGSNFINLTFTTSSFGWETGLAQKLVWNVAPVVGQIYNITCTYDPNTSTSIIYYNGAQVAINTSSTVQHTSQTAQLKLDYNPTFNLFNGVIYNCFFYTNKVLSPTEVTQNFDAQKARFGL